MSDRITTKAGVFESGDQDAMDVQYKDGRLIACRNPKLTDYAVADGTEVICDRAFMNMKELRSIILPASLKAIGESAFSGCKALADISIPEGVTEIRQATFRDCDALTAIELPASVTEIEKFAFGRGLTTLVVNATGMKIDRYAFMNARDFSTLMVPDGTADYYRALLADMRVKADVEEIEGKPETPVSLLDAFIEDPESVADEMKNIISSNSNDIIMKKIKVCIYGFEKFLDAQDMDGDPIDGRSRFAADDNLIFEIDGKDYKLSDFAECDCGNDDFEGHGEINAEEFFKECGATKGMLYLNKASSEEFEIEVPDGENFDPNKASVVCRDFVYPDGTDEPMLVAFIYNGKAYTDVTPADSVGKGATMIWQAPIEVGTEYTDQTASDEQLADVSELPVLVFRYQTLSYCYEAGDAYDFEADDYPDLEGPGVISAVDDAGMGKMIICQDCIEYISSGEMNDELGDLLDYEITLAATEKDFILLNSNPNQRPAQQKLLETIAAVWQLSSNNSSCKPVFDKLIFRAIARGLEDYTTNGDYLLDHGKIYVLPEGKFDEIIAGLSDEDQALNQDITPFDEYEEE